MRKKVRSWVAMIQTLPERMSFTEFVKWHQDNGRRYELHNGIVIEMQLCDFSSGRNVEV
ncbi:hypothetical protein Glo7428_1730 [Gloeocapsa sp. PCC 7428]|nr:hypothetical protein Glo7428_1730 [Gloeocapsa sp. PCC 7428]